LIPQVDSLDRSIAESQYYYIITFEQKSFPKYPHEKKELGRTN
jgi:hypothetical protein